MEDSGGSDIEVIEEVENFGPGTDKNVVKAIFDQHLSDDDLWNIDGEIDESYAANKAKRSSLRKRRSGGRNGHVQKVLRDIIDDGEMEYNTDPDDFFTIFDRNVEHNSDGRLYSEKSKRKSRSFRRTQPSSSDAKKFDVVTVVSDDNDDLRGSHEIPEATTSDKDDVESLLSIPSPSASVKCFPSSYDNGNLLDVLENNRPEPKKENGKGRPINTFYGDRASQEFDDYFREVQYSSLEDYLAEAGYGASASGSSSTTAGSLPGSSKSTQIDESSTSPLHGSSKKPKVTYDTVVAHKLQLQQSSTSYGRNKNNKPKSTVDAVEAHQKKPAKLVSSASKENSSNSYTGSGVQNINTEVQRKFKSGEALKMIILKISDGVLSDELAAKLLEKEVRFEIVDRPNIANSIDFEHNVLYKQQGTDLQVHEKVWKEMDENTIIIFPIEQYLNLLQGELDKLDSQPLDSSSEAEESLTEWFQKLKKKNPKKKLTLLIHGLQGYLRKLKRKKNAEFRKGILNSDEQDGGTKKRKPSSRRGVGIELSFHEVQNALIGFQLQTRTNYRFYEDSTELSNLLVHYAKSIAEAPQKQEQLKSLNFDWYAAADSVGGIPVEEDGRGMRSLWIDQLRQFPGVGGESALAISRLYSSPRELCRAYRKCTSAEAGKNLLSDIQVRVGTGPCAKTRRLGPEASKKVYRFFTATDGELEI